MMQASRGSSLDSKGVSVITCTNREWLIGSLFDNYRRQRHPKKELIIIVNSSRIRLTGYQQQAKKLKNVRIFRLSERFSLGSCLNIAVKKAKHAYIAKFDDDDYYAPYYLTDSLRAMIKAGADIVGKRTHYMYLRGSKTLLLRFPGEENRSVALLPGATLVIKRSVFDRVQFPNRSIGEDDEFCRRCKRNGFKVYSAGKHNFVAIRRKNSYKHTWIISDKTLIAHHRKIGNVQDYRSFVRRKPSG